MTWTPLSHLHSSAYCLPLEAEIFFFFLYARYCVLFFYLFNILIF